MKDDDKIIRFPKNCNDKDNSIHHIILSSVLNDDESNTSTDKDSKTDQEDIDVEVIPPNHHQSSPFSDSEEDIIDVDFDNSSSSNPFNKIISFLVNKMNQYFYMDKNEKKEKKNKDFKDEPKEENEESQKCEENNQQSDSSIDIITSRIVDENNVYIFEDLVRENNLEKLKMLFKNNDKLKNWVKNSYPIYRLSKEVLDIIDGKE